MLGVTIDPVPGEAVISATPEEPARKPGTEHGRRFPDIRGVTGPRSGAGEFTRGAGPKVERTTIIMPQDLFVLERVLDVPEACGQSRPAEASDAQRLQG